MTGNTQGLDVDAEVARAAARQPGTAQHAPNVASERLSQPSAAGQPLHTKHASFAKSHEFQNASVAAIVHARQGDTHLGPSNQQRFAMSVLLSTTMTRLSLCDE